MRKKVELEILREKTRNRGRLAYPRALIHQKAAPCVILNAKVSGKHEKNGYTQGKIDNEQKG